MWSQRRPRIRSLAGQMLLLQLVVIAVVLLAVAAVSIHQSTVEFRDLQGQRMIAVAETVASTPVVRDRLGAQDLERVLAPEVDRAVNLSDATITDIVTPDGLVVVSSDPTRLRTAADLGSSDVMSGRAWTGDVEADGRRSIAGQVPILSRSGEVLAVVSVAQNYPSVWELLSGAGARLVLYLGIGAGLGAVGSWLLSRRIKTHTRGLEIAEIASLADHREALLHSIREGVVAVNTDGVITVLNDSARELLDLPGDIVGHHVDEVALDTGVRRYLQSADDSGDVVLSTASRMLALSRRAATSQGHRIGTVTTMRDSTELASLQSQLSSHKSVTDTLRAQTHEFSNQLHTISGLTQLGDYDAVTDFVGTLTRRRAEISDAVTTRISDPAVAALLIAKTSLAAETGVELTLAPGSRLRALGPELATDVITVVGNLVDNAVDVSEGTRGSTIRVRITDTDGILVEVADSGPGVPESMREEIFSRGITSKAGVPGGRGIGLALVRLVTSQHGGTAAVTDAPEPGGALFTVHLPRGYTSGS
ncbi:ATP-binding protein [Rhodococcus sp. NPDC058521]|uniref:sensor histidine kinase n=1 Tax=Rhodococcus sp. NPDC058521 TaxID=3346536 RepID=UPI0036637C61